MKNVRTLLGLVVLALLALAAACSKSDSEHSPSVALGPLPERGLAGSIEPAAELKIVSLMPSLTELVFALELGPRLVGRTQDCDSPTAAQGVASVGSGLNPDAEFLVSLEPDLVLIGESQRSLAVLEHLRQHGAAVLVMPMSSLSDLEDSITLMTEHIGGEEAAARLLAELHDSMQEIDRRPPMPALAPPPSEREDPDDDDSSDEEDEELAEDGEPVRRLVGSISGDPSVVMRSLVVVGHSPFYGAGPNSFVHEMLLAAGGRNALSRGDWLQLSSEAILTIAPMVIIDASEEGEDPSRWQFLVELGEQMPHICAIDPSLVSRLGPRTPAGIAAIQHCLELGRALRGGN